MNEDDIYRAKVLRYLAIAAKHGYINYLRKFRALPRTISLEVFMEPVFPDGWEEDPLEGIIRREGLAEAYAKLPETYRKVLVLLVVYGLSPRKRQLD